MMRALAWIFGLAGLMALVASAFAYAVLKPTGFDWVAIVAIAGLAGVGVWFATYWSTLRALGDDLATGRIAVAAFAVVLTLGIAVVANVAVHRYDQRWDVTQDQRYSLSPQSIEIASKLDREVEVLAFFVSGSPDEGNFRNLMDGYEAHTTLLKVSFHDPYSDPLLTEQMKVLSANGTVILKAGEQTQRLETTFGEEAFTNALVRLTSDTFHDVCAVTGHGEHDIADEYSEDGLGFAKIKLEGLNYRVSPLNLLERQPTPEDCVVVILAGPQADLAPRERDRLARYVAAGGGLIAMMDPLQAPETSADLSRYGVKLGSDVVIEGDPARQFQGGQPTLIQLDPDSYDHSEITDKLRGISVLTLARSVDKGPDVAGLDVQVLARASDLSWAETKLDDPNVPATPDPGVDIVGRVPVIASVQVSDPAALRTTTAVDAPAGTMPQLEVATQADDTPAPPAKAGGKVVVYGDSDFATNLWLTKYTNQDLFLNAVAWMAGETDQLAIKPNEAAKGKLDVSLLGLVVSGLMTILVVPGVAIMGMTGTWLRRRRL